VRSLESPRLPRKTLLALALFAAAATIPSLAEVSNISAQPSASSPEVALVETPAARTEEAPAAAPDPMLSLSSPAIVSVQPPVPSQPPPARYGGSHEFTVTAGLSEMSGHWFGYRKDVVVEVINLRYARVISRGRHFTASYSSELTPYINIDEPIYNVNDMGPVEIGRKQTVGGGITPVGFNFDFYPGRRIQPFFRVDYGVLYYHDRVLSPEGSQFMHTVDFGVGVHIFQTRTTSTTLGFRYIHMSNADISEHNPGTDAETFFVGLSRFHSSKSRRIE
jgi:hypothetical protein